MDERYGSKEGSRWEVWKQGGKWMRGTEARREVDGRFGSKEGSR